MSGQSLDFEREITEIDEKITELSLLSSDSDPKIADEIQRLEKKRHAKLQSVFNKITPWQTTQLARHPLRPHSLDYISRIFTDFDELQGDRHFAADNAMVGGTARLGDTPVMVVGHQKGRKVKEKVVRNFAMARPEGYRKALRLMRMAEKFSLPIITFIDTPGAYPGIDAEERNQSEAIATNLLAMSQLRVPIISCVIGEGGSGGALAIGVADRVLMLEYSIYSVISPEGCASILWKSSERAPDAAQAMGVTASDSLRHGLVDEVIPEPLGGAHRQVDAMSQALKGRLAAQLEPLLVKSVDDLVAERYQRYRHMGMRGTT